MTFALFKGIACRNVFKCPEYLWYTYTCIIQVESYLYETIYEGGSICNETPVITPSTNGLGLYAICQTKDQSIAVVMVQETLFYLSKFNKLETF